MGMIPLPLIRPRVGLMPTSPHADDGQTTEPSVSVPTPTAARLAAMGAPVPELQPPGARVAGPPPPARGLGGWAARVRELDPQGWRASTYGLCVGPPRPLHPLV